VKAEFQNPVSLNEIRRYKISTDDYRYLFTVPIDLRFGKIEMLFKRCRHISGDFDIRDTNISPLICTWNMFFKYFRSRAIEESDPCFFSLFKEPDTKVDKTKLNNVTWSFYQYTDNTDITTELRDEFFYVVPEEYHNDIIRNLEGIWDSYFYPYSSIINNQALIFVINNYEIHVYTLGDIASYRYKEARREVLHIPSYANLKDGVYYIDY